MAPRIRLPGGPDKPPARLTNPGKINKNPPIQVRKRQPAAALGAVQGSVDPILQFGEDKYPYGRVPEGPPENTEYDVRPAALYIANGKGGVIDSSKFEFWCMEVNFGYGAKGNTSASKFYEAFYAQAFNQTPISVKGRVPTEKFKDDMSEWIREAQVNMARGFPRIRFVVPAADIAVWGFIPSFSSGHEAGYPPAPEISFDFIVTRDRRKVGNAGRVSQNIIPYFLDPNKNLWRRKNSNLVLDFSDEEGQDVTNATRGGPVPGGDDIFGF